MPSSPRTKTDLIYTTACPWDHEYQGKDKRVLFVCSAGLLRSATAARMYAPRYNTRAAGSHEYALVPLSNALVLWAQEIVFVNKENYDYASYRYDFSEHDVKVLDIPDKYNHMHPELIKAFEEQYEPL